MDIPQTIVYFLIWIIGAFWLPFGALYIFITFIFRLMHESEKGIL